MNNESLLDWIEKIGILLLVAITLYLLYTLEAVVFIFCISGLLTLMLHGAIEAWEKYHVRPWITLSLIYLCAFFAITVVVSNILPIFVEYISQGIGKLTEWLTTLQTAISLKNVNSLHFNPYIEHVLNFLMGRVNLEQVLNFIKSNAGAIQTFISNQVSTITTWGFSIIGNVGSVVTQTVFIAIMTFLMAMERKRLGQLLLDLVPVTSSRYIKKHFHAVQTIIHHWLRGQMILGLCIFTIVLIGLTVIEWIFGVSSGKVWSLAMIAGIMEFIPYIGPIIALIPALVVGLGFSWEVGITILIFYTIMQQVENNVLVPYIMSKSLDLSPLFVFVVMLAWGILGGILGIILAVPTAAILQLIVLEYIRYKKNIDKDDTFHTITPVAPKTKPAK